MRTRLAPLLAALLVVFLFVAALPARAEGPVPPNPRNLKGNDRTPQILRPVPQAVVAPGPTYTYDDIPASSIAIDRRTRCNGGEIVRTFNVPDSFTVYDVNLGFNANHEFRGDTRVTLQSPKGTQVVVISEDSDNTALNFDLMLDDGAFTPIDDASDDDTAEPYYDRAAQPSYALSAFNGQSSNGTWTLRICDTYTQAGDGAYNRARLELQSPPTTPALEASKTADKHVVAAGMTIAYTITIHNAGLAGASGVNLSDPIPAGSTYVSGSVSTVGTPAASFDGAAIVWSGDVAAGASIIVSYQVTAGASTGYIENSATMTHQSLAYPLEAWVTSQIFAGQNYLYTDETGYDIPDNGCASPLAAPIVVGESFTVGDVQVGLNMNHTFRGDLSASLTSPLGTQVQLIVPDGSVVHDNYDVRFDSISTDPLDDGNPDDTDVPFYDRTAAPAASLGAFAGEDAQGTWTLLICDSSELDVGVLNHWSLFFDTNAAPCVAPAAVADLRITKLSATQVTLNWTAVGGAGKYYLWRGSTPYFTPGAACSPPDCVEVTAPPSGPQLALGDTTVNYAWIVLPVAACDPNPVQTSPSNRVAEFEFQLTPGAG